MDSIFTTQVPGGSFGDGAPGLTLGTVLVADVVGQVHGIRWYVPSTAPTGTVQGLLYRHSDGAQLAAANFGTLTPGTWASTTFASPVTISASAAYVAAVWTADWYPYTGSFFTSGPLVNGHLTAYQHNVAPGFIINGTYVVNASPTYPTGNPGGACYFADVLWTSGLSYPMGRVIETSVVRAAAVSKARTLGRVASPTVVRAATVGKTYAMGRVIETSVVRQLAIHLPERGIDLSAGAPRVGWLAGAPRLGWAAGTPRT